ncbi:MAG: hypothetical protein JWN64_222 [Parcubacteria group bacterium]|nr:hypothetical protein [Parcubacteria group bacterium]
MELQELMEKVKTGELTKEEQEDIFTKVNEELLSLKDSDPEKYLELLKQLNNTLEELNKDVSSL